MTEDEKRALYERLALRESFPLWVTESIRYVDMDTQGRVNNAYYSTYFEMGRVATRPALAMLPGHAMPVIAEQTVRYRMPLAYPARIDIGTGIARIGRSSYDVGHCVFLGEGCAATGILIYVLVDANTGKAMPLPEAFRTKLEEIRLR